MTKRIAQTRLRLAPASLASALERDRGVSGREWHPPLRLLSRCGTRLCLEVLILLSCCLLGSIFRGSTSSALCAGIFTGTSRHPVAWGPRRSQKAARGVIGRPAHPLTADVLRGFSCARPLCCLIPDLPIGITESPAGAAEPPSRPSENRPSMKSPRPHSHRGWQCIGRPRQCGRLAAGSSPSPTPTSQRLGGRGQVAE